MGCLSEKVAIVTGSSRGLGRAIAWEFAEHGAKVVVNYNESKEPAEALKTPLEAEFSDRKHVFGSVSMARTTDPNSALTEFFICFDEVPHLDRNYTVFARVVEGLDAVRSVERAPSDHSPCGKGKKDHPVPGATACCGRHHADKPKNDVVIKRVTVTVRKGKK